MEENKGVAFASPATTPGSLFDEERFLVPHSFLPRPKTTTWQEKYKPPYGVISISALQWVFYISSNDSMEKLLRYEPYNQIEVWRFVTYMFLHNSIYHLLLNVVIQCLFAVQLEKIQGRFRVALLYLGGGVFGALGASCVQPDPVIGASAGVYALLISHVAHLILNLENVKYKIYRCISVCIIVGSDITYNLAHASSIGEPIISWGAHTAGAFAGLFLGLIVYTSINEEDCVKIKNRIAFWTGLALFVSLLAILIALNIQIRKCTPEKLLKHCYVYIC